MKICRSDRVPKLSVRPLQILYNLVQVIFMEEKEKKAKEKEREKRKERERHRTKLSLSSAM